MLNRTLDMNSVFGVCSEPKLGLNCRSIFSRFLCMNSATESEKSSFSGRTETLFFSRKLNASSTSMVSDMLQSTLVFFSMLSTNLNIPSGFLSLASFIRNLMESTTSRRTLLEENIFSFSKNTIHISHSFSYVLQNPYFT